MAHGHESTICVKGFNGIQLESTFSEEKTADFLENIRLKASKRDSYRKYLEGKTKYSFEICVLSLKPNLSD